MLVWDAGTRTESCRVPRRWARSEPTDTPSILLHVLGLVGCVSAGERGLKGGAGGVSRCAGRDACPGHMGPGSASEEPIPASGPNPLDCPGNSPMARPVEDRELARPHLEVGEGGGDPAGPALRSRIPAGACPDAGFVRRARRHAQRVPVHVQSVKISITDLLEGEDEHPTLDGWVPTLCTEGRTGPHLPGCWPRCRCLLEQQLTQCMQPLKSEVWAARAPSMRSWVKAATAPGR